MMERIKNLSLFLVISTVIQLISVWLQSNFIGSFLKENLITLLLALMAINTTTISVIMTKLRDISDNDGVDFSRTIMAMRESIVEQVVLLVIAGSLLILQSSELLRVQWKSMDMISNILLLSTFLCSIQILYDTAQGVFVISKKENDLLIKRVERKPDNQNNNL